MQEASRLRGSRTPLAHRCSHPLSLRERVRVRAARRAKMAASWAVARALTLPSPGGRGFSSVNGVCSLYGLYRSKPTGFCPLGIFRRPIAPILCLRNRGPAEFPILEGGSTMSKLMGVIVLAALAAAPASAQTTLPSLGGTGKRESEQIVLAGGDTPNR